MTDLTFELRITRCEDAVGIREVYMERSEYREPAMLNLVLVACYAFMLTAFGATVFALIKLILAEYNNIERNAMLSVYFS